MVIAVTASVMVGNSAQNIILNGVAIFFVVDVDNIFFSFFMNSDEQEKLKEQSTMNLDKRDTRYVTLISLLSGIVLTAVLVLVPIFKSEILSALDYCKSDYGLFRGGGLFCVCLLFGSYFLAQLGVPVIGLFYRDNGRKKSLSGLKAAFSEGWFNVSTSRGVLNFISQIRALLFIVVQGVAGAFLFILIVKGYYEGNYGFSLAKYNAVDPYGTIVKSWFNSSYGYKYYYDSDYYWPSE
jgi:hypothetical protein